MVRFSAAGCLKDERSLIWPDSHQILRKNASRARKAAASTRPPPRPAVWRRGDHRPRQLVGRTIERGDASLDVPPDDAHRKTQSVFHALAFRRLEIRSAIHEF